MIDISKARRLPQRTCIGCGEVFDKKDLLRIVRVPDGHVEMDATGKKAGRGAYVCRKISCLDKALKGKKVERSLGCQVSQDDIDRMREEINKSSDE